MVTNANVILTSRTTIACLDGPDVPYLVIDLAGDYRTTVAIMLGDSAERDEVPAALAQLAAIRKALDDAGRLIAIRYLALGEPDDDDDDDVEAGAAPADAPAHGSQAAPDHTNTPAPTASPEDDDSGAGVFTMAELDDRLAADDPLGYGAELAQQEAAAADPLSNRSRGRAAVDLAAGLVSLGMDTEEAVAYAFPSTYGHDWPLAEREARAAVERRYPELVTTRTYRQAHPMTEAEQRAAWGDR